MSVPLLWDGRIPLAQVLEHVIPAYGGDTWSEVFAYLYGTPSEAQVIADLSASLARTGAGEFTEPVCIFPLDTDTDDEPDDVDPLGRTWRVGNGMHRIATAALLGHDHITTSTAYPAEDSETHYVEVVYELAPDWANHTPDGDTDDLDYSCGWLRSFPLPDGVWVESDFFSGSGAHLEGLWRCPPTHVEAFLTELHTRAPGMTVHRVTTKTAAELDAEYEAAGV